MDELIDDETHAQASTAYAALNLGAMAIADNPAGTPEQKEKKDPRWRVWCRKGIQVAKITLRVVIVVYHLQRWIFRD